MLAALNAAGIPPGLIRGGDLGGGDDDDGEIHEASDLAGDEEESCFSIVVFE